MFTAKKRGNPFAARRQRKQADQVQETAESTPTDDTPKTENVESSIIAEASTELEDPKYIDGVRPRRGRGRPRPQDTIDRDNAVMTLLEAHPDGIAKAEIAARLGEKEQQVYSSLRQLSKEGRAVNRSVKGVGYRWFSVADQG